MRKISREAMLALTNGYDMTKSNTRVRDRAMYLHGRKIAWYDSRWGLIVSDGGYPLSFTTKERLNALPGVRVWTSKHVDYISTGGHPASEWDGEPWVVLLGVPLEHVKDDDPDQDLLDLLRKDMEDALF